MPTSFATSPQYMIHVKYGLWSCEMWSPNPKRTGWTSSINWCSSCSTLPFLQVVPGADIKTELILALFSAKVSSALPLKSPSYFACLPASLPCLLPSGVALAGWADGSLVFFNSRFFVTHTGVSLNKCTVPPGLSHFSIFWWSLDENYPRTNCTAQRPQTTGTLQLPHRHRAAASSSLKSSVTWLIPGTHWLFWLPSSDHVQLCFLSLLAVAIWWPSENVTMLVFVLTASPTSRERAAGSWVNTHLVRSPVHSPTGGPKYFCSISTLPAQVDTKHLVFLVGQAIPSWAC